jgi:hypothetical protein
MERICAIVKPLKLIATLFAEKTMSPVMARALELEARQGPLSCANTEAADASVRIRMARRAARNFI